MFLEVRSVPHIQVRDEEHRRQIETDFWDDYRVLVDSLIRSPVSLRFSHLPPNPPQAGYEISDQTAISNRWTEPGRYLDLVLHPSNPPAPPGTLLELSRSVVRVPVGSLWLADRRSTIPLLPRGFRLDDKAEKVFQVPITRPLMGGSKTCHWRHLLSAIAQYAGVVRLALQPIEAGPAEIAWMQTAIGLYRRSYHDLRTDEGAVTDLAVYNAATAHDQLFELTIRIWGPSQQKLARALMDDLHPLALEPAPAPANGSQDLPCQIESAICRWCALTEAQSLLAPPFTFGDQLRALPHFVPRPFALSSCPRPAKNAIPLGHGADGSPVEISADNLPRQVGYFGATRYGKSTALRHLLKRLNGLKLPFLVIDPAKGDYRPFANSLGIKVFDFGADPREWLYFNPFIPPPRSTVYSHAGLLARAFALMAPANPVAADLIARFVLSTYEAKLAKYRPGMTLFHTLGGHLYKDHRLIPTFADFVSTALGELKTMPGQGSTWMMDAMAFFERRMERAHKSILHSVFTGAPAAAAPVYGLFDEPALVQLQAISDGWPEEADTLFFLIVSLLIAYRKNEGLTESLRHALVVEEAHRLFPAKPRRLGADYGSSPAEESGRAMAESLAEAGGYGQSIILVDQSPVSIRPEALINTTTRLFFRAKDGDNLEAIARAAGLDSNQAAHLATLPRGRALAELPDQAFPVLLDSLPPEKL